MDTRRLRHIVLAFAMLAVGCDAGIQSAQITAQDFRFAPDTIRLDANRPVRLTLVNEGREPHEFESPLLSAPAVRVVSADESHASPPPISVRILPAQHIDLILQIPAGTYLFHCKVHGHAGMSGTIIVE